MTRPPAPGRRRTTTAMLVLAALLAGCGGDGRTDEQQVRDVLAGFGQATEKKDYQRLCDDLLAPKLLESVEQIGLPCEIALQRGLEDVEEPRLVVGRVTIRGDKATAEVRSSAKGQSPSRDEIELVRSGDRWKISELAGEPTPTSTP